MIDILERDGLSVELLSSLSYKSELGISLKKNLSWGYRLRRTCIILIGTFCLLSSLKLMSGIKAKRHWLTCL